jgi:hypothetical protein
MQIAYNALYNPLSKSCPFMQWFYFTKSQNYEGKPENRGAGVHPPPLFSGTPSTFVIYSILVSGEELRMINLREKNTGNPLGQISEAQLQYLIENLEEEWLEDQDYAITPLLLQVFENQNADPELVSLLRNALAGRDVVEVVWSR